MSKSGKKRKFEGVSKSGSESSNDSGSSLSDKDKVSGDEVETVAEVYVIDKTTGRKRWIELSSDGTLDFSTVEHGFPGCYGLEYSSSNRYHVVRFNDNKKAFETPSEGWKGKEFEVIYRDLAEKRPSTPYNSVQEGNRLSTASACPVKKSGKDNRDLPTSPAVQDFSFYILENGIKSSVICLEKDFFSTFRHGTHKNFNLRDVVTIYNYNGKESMEATVRYINERLDFIILKTTKQVEKVPFLCRDFLPAEDLIVCGRSGASGELTYGKGCIRTSILQYFSGKGPFLLADIHTLPGDSGAPVFGERGLIGMNLGVVLYHNLTINYMVKTSDLIHGIDVVKHEDSPARPGSREEPPRIRIDDEEFVGV